MAKPAKEAGDGGLGQPLGAAPPCQQRLAFAILLAEAVVSGVDTTRK